MLRSRFTSVMMLFCVLFLILPPVKSQAEQAHVRVTILAGGAAGGRVQAQAEGLAARREAVLSSVRSAGIAAQTVHVFSGAALNGVTLDIPASELPRLQQAAGANRVYVNHPVYALEEESIDLIGAPSVWAMHDAQNLPVTGKGVKIAIIDTGVDYNHPDLGGCLGQELGKDCKVTGGWDFVDNDADPLDCNGHGTHVAGIAAANGTIHGVAPDAKVLAYRVLGCNGSGDDSLAAAAIDRAVADGAAVINLSLGSPGSPDDLLSQAADNAAAAGVVVVAAAGNSGGYDQPVFNSVLSPAVARGAIAVANADWQNDSYYMTSSKGPLPGDTKLSKPEISAPGVNIYSTWLTSDELHYAFLTGTSMAAPHVAGTAALLRQMHPDWTPEMIRSALISTALPITYNPEYASGEPLAAEMGAGRLRADWAARAPLLALPAEEDFGVVLRRQPAQAVIQLRNISSSARVVSTSISVRHVMQTHAEALVLPIEIIPPGVATLSQCAFPLAAGKTCNLALTINTAGLPGGYYEGKITLNLDAGNTPARIPFTFWVDDHEYHLPIIGKH